MTDAADLARHWGETAAPPRPVRIGENEVFEVRFLDGRRAALRLHRPGYQSAAAIAAELDWMARLAARGLTVPLPLATEAGAWIAVHRGRCATAISWVDGVGLSAAATTAPADLYTRLGALIARLHAESHGLAHDVRPRWDIAAILGPRPRWGVADADAFVGGERADVERAAAAVRLTDIAHCASGAIHGDLLVDNVLVSGDALWLIDFDDGGWGYHAYDLATALVGHVGQPSYPLLRDALVAGYGAPGIARDLPLFVFLRALASAGWAATRTGTGDPRRRAHAARAAVAARAFLEA